MTDSDQKSGGGYLNGLLTGLIFGAATVFFLGTKQGRHLAKTARRKGKKGFSELEHLLADIENKSQDFAQKAQVFTQELEVKAQSVKQEVSQRAQEELGHIRDLQEKDRAVSQNFFPRNGKSLG